VVTCRKGKKGYFFHMLHPRRFTGLIFLIFSYPFSLQSQNLWAASSPEDQGMNSITFIDAIKGFQKNGTNIHSLLIIKNDHVVLEAGFFPFQMPYPHDLASVTKSITSLLIGIAIDKGFIKDENQLVFPYFPEYATKNDTLKTVRVRDLLNMTSGFQCSWDDGEKELNQMIQSIDWVQYMFSLPFESMPGQKFSYCSGNYYLLGEILQRTTKMTCHDFAEKYLFGPLGFGKSYWLLNYKGVNNGWGDLHLSTYDMAKIGRLLLFDGNWNGKQIVSKAWIDKIKPLYKIQKTESYGYGWWLDSENPDEIQAVGRGGQRLFVFRDKKMVIATTGGGFEAGDVDNLALESIQSYKKNENYGIQLKQLVKTVEAPVSPSVNVDEKEFPNGILNKTFRFDRNDLGLRTIRFEQRKAINYLMLVFNDGTIEAHPIGMNNQYLISNEATFGLPMAVRGKWVNANTLAIDYNRLCRIEDYHFSIEFLDNAISLDITEPTKEIHEILRAKSN
jgi:CubicO group peptidase (beta-lactamase class C family)